MPDVDVIAATERVVLRPWRIDEADRFFDMHRRREVADWIGGRPMKERGEAVSLIERNLDRLASDSRFGVWAIVERSSGIPAGSALLKPLPDGEGEIEVGWHLHPDSWGHGLATEAGAALVARGFAVGLSEIWAVTHRANDRSIGVCRKLGMRLLGVTHRWYHEPSLMFWIAADPAQRPSLNPDESVPEAVSPARGVVVQLEPAASDRAQQILYSYLEEVVSRYHQRPATAGEMAAALQESPIDDLTPPRGELLVARVNGASVGCVGLRRLAEGTGEVTRLFVVKHARGHGLGMRLMDELEELARNHGLTRLRLDTRHDLIEARGIYARRGFREVAPFNRGAYAEHWFEKTL